MIETYNDLSYILSAEIRQLKAIEYNKERFYKTFEIRKKIGKRLIHAPDHRLKPIQRHILERILYKFPVHKSAHGFVEARSILTHSSFHVRKNAVLKIDIADFFPSITSERVLELFRSLSKRVRFTEFAAHRLMELTTYKGTLPQGAPTSPYIANLVCKRMDKRLYKFAKVCGLKYSRYADDITFSGSDVNGSMIHTIKKIIGEEGFRINDEKTRVMGKGTRQIVTGLVVNEKLGIGRRKYRILRALVNNCLKFNLSVMKPYLMGKIAILKKTDYTKWEMLRDKIAALETPDESQRLIYDKQIGLGILSCISDIEKLVGCLIFNCDKEKAENLLIACRSKPEFNSRMQTLFRIISDGDYSYFKKNLTPAELQYRKHIGIIELFLSKNGINSSFLAVWDDISDISAGLTRHKPKEYLIETLKKYDAHGKPDYRLAWQNILNAFNASFETLLERLMEISEKNKSHLKAIQ